MRTKRREVKWINGQKIETKKKTQGDGLYIVKTEE